MDRERRGLIRWLSAAAMTVVMLCTAVLFYVAKERKNYVLSKRDAARYLRLAAGATYRIPTPFNAGLPGSYSIDVQSLRAISYTVTLKLGKF